ncbi:MAG: protein phosphatase 2C domain-containing protein [Acidobacteriota bacterium]|nr:MAG: protein phosphatase 2C domain-containing protein [Acidobacteriota bacterium]
MDTPAVARGVLFCEQDLREPTPVALAGGTAWVFTTRAPDKATFNEDAAAVLPYGEQAGLLVVADGVGGRPVGAEAARRALVALEESLSDGRESGLPLRVAVLDGIERANRELLELGTGSATTLAVAQIRERHVRPYHVGDSMILHVGQRGKLRHLTVSHSPVGYAYEAGLLDEKEALHHEDRHFVSNTIGAPDMHITIGSSAPLRPRDTLLVASDGLADNFTTEELKERIRTGPLWAVARSLADQSRQRMLEPRQDQPGKIDDLTLIVFRLDR